MVVTHVPESPSAASPPSPASDPSVASPASPASEPPPPEDELLEDELLLPAPEDELPAPEDELPAPDDELLLPAPEDELLPAPDDELLLDASGVPLLSSPPHPATATAAATDPATTHPKTMRTELTSFAMKSPSFWGLVSTTQPPGDGRAFVHARTGHPDIGAESPTGFSLEAPRGRRGYPHVR
jgi:hypothetical protein